MLNPAQHDTMGAAFNEVFVSDCFIADSQELAVLTRRDVDVPKSIGLLMPSTSSYVDLTKWEEHVNIPSLPYVYEKLIAGEIDSGLTYTALAAKNPDLVRVDEVLGSPDDVWVVYSRKRMSQKGGIVADKNGAFAAALQEMAKA